MSSFSANQALFKELKENENLFIGAFIDKNIDQSMSIFYKKWYNSVQRKKSKPLELLNIVCKDIFDNLIEPRSSDLSTFFNSLEYDNDNHMGFGFIYESEADDSNYVNIFNGLLKKVPSCAFTETHINGNCVKNVCIPCLLSGQDKPIADLKKHVSIEHMPIFISNGEVVRVNIVDICLSKNFVSIRRDKISNVFSVDNESAFICPPVETQKIVSFINRKRKISSGDVDVCLNRNEKTSSNELSHETTEKKKRLGFESTRITESKDSKVSCLNLKFFIDYISYNPYIIFLLIIFLIILL
ncbi:MAG: hypothetical protein QM535_15035 [Limnohabitans sp.]|nr:hypothetical protein [Limnohabitans sp.]